MSNQNEKLKDVLRLFLLPDYTIASTTYFDILLSHIGKNTSNTCSINANAIDKSILQKWVVEALGTWTTGRKPCQAVVTFTLKLVGLIGSNEFDFLYWYREDIFKKLSTVFALREDNLQASVKMAYTGMLMEFIQHYSGRQWIIETGAWRDVIKFCHSNHTLYVTRESQKFVCKLLLFEAGNSKFCEEVIVAAAEPLIKNTFSPQVYPTLEDNYLDQNELLLTIIDLLTAIMENTLFVSLDNTIPRLVESVTNLESRIKGLFETCISTKFFAHIMKLMYLLLFLKLKDGIKANEETVDPETLKIFFMNLRYIDSMLLAKKYVLDMVRGAKLLLLYWKKMNNLCKIKMPEDYKPEHQCTIIMVMPLCTCIFVHEMDEDIMNIFVQKLFKISCNYTQRLCFMLRDTLLKEEMPLENICKTAIQIAMDIVDVIDRDCAVIIFQVMSYVLKDYMPTPTGTARGHKSVGLPEKENPRIPRLKRILDGDPIVQCPNMLAALLDGLATIIHKFKLKWQECLETISILPLAQNILDHPNVTPKLCVQALTLCKLAIKNFMAPNLALLVHSDSPTDEMGPVLFKRMHDPNWEVRDSVLEVISTIATISEDKYPGFQDLLLENGFPQLIFDVAASDGESYVRATALTCITIFVRINRIWKEKLCQLDLPKMAIKLITNESEAIVRREAVILVKALYVHRKWPKSTVDEMAKAMSVAAVLDLHWEVKVNALQFWRQFIKSHLSDQGMLDGIFPTVTFSKEHRKIVSLDDYEVKKRILKALDELAGHNCLGVLLATLEDDSDFQVCKASAEIIKKLKDIFVMYKVSETAAEIDEVNLSDLPSTPKLNAESSLSNHNAAVPSEANQPPKATDIIDSIVDADDMNLLASVYKHTMNMNADSEPTDSEKLKYISNVKKNQFLRSVLGCDIDAYIEEKNRWLKTYTNSFGSVIDDILVAHERNNINEMDCY